MRTGDERLSERLSRSSATGPDAWRLTADLLFVIEQPEIREAFFASTDSAVAMDSALHQDHAALLDIVRRHELPEWQPVFEAWWKLARTAFRVARAADGEPLGFGLAAPADALPAQLSEQDPLLDAWQRDLRSGPGHARGAPRDGARPRLPHHFG